MVTIPGEALSDLGTEIRNDLLNMKFDNVLLGGYGVKDTSCLTNVIVLSTQMGTRLFKLLCVLLEYLYHAPLVKSCINQSFMISDGFKFLQSSIDNFSYMPARIK